MACNEFVMDLGECLDDGMLGVEVTEGEKEVKGKGRSWSKEKGRFICLVPVCKRKQVSFTQRFTLYRHWEEVHTKQITLYKCCTRLNCRTFKRPYDLERHLVKAHHVPTDEAKKHCSSGEVKSKIVDNINYVDPGHLSPPERKTSVPATVHLISGTVPGVTVVDLRKLKVNFDTKIKT